MSKISNKKQRQIIVQNNRSLFEPLCFGDWDLFDI